MIIQFLAGSRAFFPENKLRKDADFDYLEISKDQEEIYKHYKDNNNNCHHLYKDIPKEKLLHWHLYINDFPMNVCSLIIPEFCEHFGFTIQELQPIFYKARYANGKFWAIVVFDYYVRNNGMYLTEEQLEDVYKYYIGEKNYKEHIFVDYKNKFDLSKTLFKKKLIL